MKPVIKRFSLTLVLVLILGQQSAVADEILRLVVPDFKPYSYQQNGVIQGAGVDLVADLMAELGLRYELRLVPNYGRAVLEVGSGSADGFFLASKNAERDAIAVFSEPLMINRWSWFLQAGSSLEPTDDSFKQQVQVGTFMHTNTHKWLLKNGYRVSSAVSRVELLPKMLHLGRLDAVFLAEQVFSDSAVLTGIDQAGFKQVVEVAKPFGIYIAKSYLLKHPDFMQRMNRAISQLKRDLDSDSVTSD